MSSPCTVIETYNELKKQMQRAEHGLAAISYPSAQPALPPPLPAQGAVAMREELKALQQMKEEGLITEEEYAEKKSMVLKRF